MADRAELVSRLAAAVAEAPAAESMTARLSWAACRLLGVDGASISVDTASPHRVTLFATDDIAARIDALHDDLGTGPAHEAFTAGRPVVVLVTEPTGDWSAFAEAAARLTAVEEVVAVPMRTGRVVVGVLTLHRSAQGRPPVDLDDAVFVADTLAAAILRDPETVADIEETGTWPSRAEVHQATGMIVGQLAIGLDDALALLRAHAFALDRTLGETAAAVVRRELVFFPDGEPHPGGAGDPGSPR